MAMDYKEKSDLVKQLAQSMGMQGGPAVKAANFDAGTGTLYVGSTVYLPEQIEAARQYCMAQMEKYKPLNDATFQTFEIAAILNEQEVGRGKGHSKKAAQQAAAEEAIRKLDN